MTRAAYRAIEGVRVTSLQERPKRRYCARCPQELILPRKSTVHCRDCADVLRLESLRPSRARELKARAREAGWDFDNPAEDLPVEVAA